MAFQRLRIRRIFLVGAGGVALVLGAAPAWGATKKGSGTQAEACATAYTSAQQSELAGRLLEAKNLLLTCTKSSCGKLLEQECLTRYARLESDIPTIVPHLTDKGATPADLQIRMDGALLTARLDEPLAVDPGVHEFTFSTGDGMVKVSQKIMILQGDLNRLIAVSLLPLEGAPPPTAAMSPTQPMPAEPEEPPPPPPGPPALPFVLGAIGVAGVGAGATLLEVGKQNTWNLAIDSLAIGAGALVGALWLFASPHSEKNPPPPPRAAFGIDVGPTPSGAVALLSGVF